eukprot:scaffold20716_cov49-Phaeocystis_antarctica.AAC.1
MMRKRRAWSHPCRSAHSSRSGRVGSRSYAPKSLTTTRAEPGPRNWSVRPYLVSGPPCRHQGRHAAKWGGPQTKFGRPSSENRAATHV